jgi:hypothetical protein
LTACEPANFEGGGYQWRLYENNVNRGFGVSEVNSAIFGA